MNGSIKYEVFKRDNYKCQYCGKAFPINELCIDHINSKSSGGSDDLSNMLTSCISCNKDRNEGLIRDYLSYVVSKNTHYYGTFLESINSIKSLLEGGGIENENRKILHKLLYVNTITAMETYLSDAFINTVLNNQQLIRKLVETSPEFQKTQIKQSEIFQWVENSKEIVKSYLFDIIYHNIGKVREMYKSVLNVDFPSNLDVVGNGIMVRHDLVHRNGKTKDSEKIIEIDDKKVEKILEETLAFINFVDKQLKQFSQEKPKVEDTVIENFMLEISNAVDKCRGGKFAAFLRAKSFIESNYGKDFMLNRKGLTKDFVNLLLEANDRLGVNKDEQWTYKHLFLPIEELEIDYDEDVEVTDIIKFDTLKSLKMQGFGMIERKDVSLIGHLNNIEELDLSRNKIRNVNFLSSLKKLKRLDINVNEIESIKSLGELKQLEHLSIFKNKISDITSLSELTKLEFLDLAQNCIKSIEPLRKLKNLKLLYLQYNEIEDITPLFQLIQLEELRIYKNRFNIQQVETLKEKLPNLKFFFYKDDLDE